MLTFPVNDEVLQVSETYEKLIKRVMVLNERVWEGRVPMPKIKKWLDNFTGQVTDPETERLHALFWLSQFMYFGSREIRVLLRSVYRDLYLCPMIHEVRATLPSDASDEDIQRAIEQSIKETTFLGVGNPSESGVHLLYYFRQENRLDKKNFTDTVQIFRKTNAPSNGMDRELRDPSIRRYVFLDDVCGSGETAVIYSREVLSDILRIDPSAKVYYLCIFASSDGLNFVRDESLFKENCAAVFELDRTYRCLSEFSRYFQPKEYPEIDPDIARRLVETYGNELDPRFASGFGDSQMLLGFHHNTPDNTLCIMWHDHTVHGGGTWTPIFKRYPKYLGGGIL